MEAVAPTVDRVPEIPKMKTCKREDCIHPVIARGYCRRHYDQFRKNGKLTPHGAPRKEKVTCRYDGCDRPAAAQGLCQAHYTQSRRGNGLSPIRKIVRQKGCNFPGCANPHYGKGYCQGHAAQLRRGISLKPLVWRWKRVPVA